MKQYYSLNMLEKLTILSDALSSLKNCPEIQDAAQFKEKVTTDEDYAHNHALKVQYGEGGKCPDCQRSFRMKTRRKKIAVQRYFECGCPDRETSVKSGTRLSNAKVRLTKWTKCLFIKDKKPSEIMREVSVEKQTAYNMRSNLCTLELPQELASKKQDFEDNLKEIKRSFEEMMEQLEHYAKTEAFRMECDQLFTKK